MPSNFEDCVQLFNKLGYPIWPDQSGGNLWCNATWDSVMCWPATPANTSITRPCPSFKGLDSTRTVTKYCHSSGRWAGHSEGNFSNPSGWTNYYNCMLIDWEVIEKAQSIARGARQLEFVGLALSFVCLITAITIFASFRRLRVFRNQLHQQLLIAILLTVIIRLILYIDQIFTSKMERVQPGQIGTTINTMNYVCEAFYAALEYGKNVAFMWMFIEGFYLHNFVVVMVFDGEPKKWKYMLAGWGIPLFHMCIWLVVLLIKHSGATVEKCLGNYYLEPEFWILDGVRLLQLVVNFVFLLNIVRVLWSKVKESHSVAERQQLQKSVRAALMLIPLLGIPNIMQTIPFQPTKTNIIGFAVFTYVASFFYMFQGFMIAVLYCFTNKEVVGVLKASWERYRTKHRLDQRHFSLLPKTNVANSCAATEADILIKRTSFQRPVTPQNA
uniref:Calcitonin receptor-like protein 1 n=1 Tax=Trichuris muris TaxID=70415 RepID=A0A5S6QQC2_TRIMR